MDPVVALKLRRVLDPTHQHPLFPEVVLALARFAGFEAGRVYLRGGSGRFEEDLYACPDYAVVLTRRRIS